jgi:hypothetical protein
LTGSPEFPESIPSPERVELSPRVANDPKTTATATHMVRRRIIGLLFMD